jgi:hypothetical protein
LFTKLSAPPPRCGRSTHNYAHELAARLGAAQLRDVTCSSAETEDGIYQRSPQARVLVTGYGLYVRPDGCWPIQPVLPADADYLQGNVDRLNRVIDAQAADHDAEYVDTETPSVGHDACQLPTARWIEGYVPLNPAAPLHPNRRGEENYARIIADHLG